MFEFIQEAEPLLQVFWYIALPTSIVFAIFTIMTFIGMDSSDGLSADFDSNFVDAISPMQMFSLRNLINFLLGFSWAGISFYGVISNQFFLVLVSIFAGLLFVLIFFYIIYQVQKLSEDNTFKIENALNKTAQVYIPIPANKQGKGKVQVSVNGAFHEIDAITEGEKIESGTIIRIVKIIDNNLLVVETI